ncbi:hypothetical protein T440DRAFT_179048 [Plenodomus tracheiphilus IPT5]|uniref:Uncharacterized protein n=1 Tax=Plenodomus tracheiphilus IPT5 TaxID=1408161 RepID=A0A6A7AY62_9PLEO|nr:hypothetical protein T440DRAFT_179048 [Plenodomus tracheiphilus IPT5]
MTNKKASVKFPAIDFDNKEGHEHGECIPHVMDMLQIWPDGPTPRQRGAAIPIEDAWDKHLEVVNEEMDEADAKGCCAHSRPYNLTHREAGDLSRFTRVLVYVDSYTREVSSETLKDLDRHFGSLEFTAKQATIASARLKNAKSRLDTEIERLGQNNTMSTASRANNETGGPHIDRLRDLCVELDAQRQVHEDKLESVHGQFSAALLFAMLGLWENKPNNCKHDETLQKQLSLANNIIMQSTDKITEQAASIKTLSLKLQDAEKSASEQGKALKVRQRNLEKSYYDDIQKRVKSRVADENINFTDRLRTAENKAQKYDKTMEKVADLLIQVAQHEKESTVNRQTRSDLERQLKIQEKEAVLLKEGYDQLSTDNYTLQLENNTLRAELEDLNTNNDTLDRERDALLKKLQSADATLSTTQSYPRAGEAPSVTPFDRQTADLQHLDGLISVWQHTFDVAVAKKEQSLAAKKAIDIRIREAESQLKLLENPHKPQKKQKSPSPKSIEKSKSHPTAVPAIVTATTLKGPGPVELPYMKSKSRFAEEAYPALGSPVAFAQKTNSTNVWKTLRLVDTAKAKAPGVKPE